MPQPKRQSRPKLDAVIRHIKAGSYDDDMGQLQGAIADRQQTRQEAVVKLVEQTFGEGYVVAPKVEKPNPFIARARQGPQEQDPELVAAELAARAREAELAKELGDGLPDDDLSSEIESRSPVIGAVDRSVAPPKPQSETVGDLASPGPPQKEDS